MYHKRDGSTNPFTTNLWYMKHDNSLVFFRSWLSISHLLDTFPHPSCSSSLTFPRNLPFSLEDKDECHPARSSRLPGTSEVPGKQLTTINSRVQFVLAVVVLGISVSLAKQQTSDDVTIGRVPFAIGLSAAAGALGLVSACFGAVSLFFDAIPTMISLGLDALAGLVFLVGGLVSSGKGDFAAVMVWHLYP